MNKFPPRVVRALTDHTACIPRWCVLGRVREYPLESLNCPPVTINSIGVWLLPAVRTPRHYDSECPLPGGRECGAQEDGWRNLASCRCLRESKEVQVRILHLGPHTAYIHVMLPLEFCCPRNHVDPRRVKANLTPAGRLWPSWRRG